MSLYYDRRHEDERNLDYFEEDEQVMGHEDNEEEELKVDHLRPRHSWHIPEDVRFGKGGGCRDVACPKVENMGKCKGKEVHFGSHVDFCLFGFFVNDFMLLGKFSFIPDSSFFRVSTFWRRRSSPFRRLLTISHKIS